MEMREVTAITRTKKRLANARERLALISSKQSLGFWRWNSTSDEMWASKAARRILGLEAGIALTRGRMLAAIHPADRAKVTRAIGATTSHLDAVEMEVRLAGRDEHSHWITMKACAYRDANGMILKVVGYVVETQFLKQQQQITHLTRVAMLGELSGAIAHELQQPLTAIMCNAQAAQMLAARADFPVKDLREMLADIIDDNKYAGQVIQRLRSLLVRGELQLQRVEIGDLVSKVLALCRGILSERRVQVEVRIEPGIAAVEGDGVELQQVLLNLILNAIESMRSNAPPDRRIDIDITRDAERGAVRISVLDRGKGIKQDQLERIFEPFCTTKTNGLGLGLAVSKSIVAAHKGRLWAAQRSGPGAAFHFTLPIAAARESEDGAGAIRRAVPQVPRDDGQRREVACEYSI
jgi:C4-dicarboxylate-specific signal transduction histidine kinase